MVSTPNLPQPLPTVSEQDSLIEYPCLFPIKVMGKQCEELIPALTTVALGTDPTFDASTMELRPSSKGTYLGVTLNVHVENRQQLDDLYRTLSSHPLVKVVL